MMNNGETLTVSSLSLAICTAEELAAAFARAREAVAAANVSATRAARRTNTLSFTSLLTTVAR